jgi:RNA polymerase sigma-70 factor, ECF subfamily
MVAAMAGRGSSLPATPGPLQGSAAAPVQGTVSDDAISELWRAHGAALLRFARKLTLGDGPRAEDIVQETLLRAWRHPEIVGSGRTAIRPWLFTVTRHIAIDMWRARARSEAAEEALDDRHGELPDPAEPIEQAVTALDVRTALAMLSAEHQQVITEMYFRGRTVAETAEILGVPVGTVKSRSYYGLRQLRRAIAGPSSQLAEADQLSA